MDVSVPEGFAYYALDPELYRMAALRFAAEAALHRVAVIGIRSIGAPLSAVVEAELRARAAAKRNRGTVRPHGHPWDRRLRIASGLERAWRAWDGVFAVVDEGPGVERFLLRFGGRIPRRYRGDA